MDGKGDAEEDSNVIRLPRDWVGPLEELVPIGPAARARERERLAREAAGSVGDVGVSADTPIAAADFWTEGASAVHHAIAGPPPTPEHVDLDHRPRNARRRPVIGHRLTERLGAPRLRRPLALPSARPRHLIAAVALAAVLVVAAVGLGEGPRHPSRLATAGVTYHPLRPVDRATAGRHAPVSDAARTDRHVTHVRRIHHPTRRHAAPRAHHARSAGSPHATVVSTPAASPEPVEPTTPATSEPVATTASNHSGSSSTGSSGARSSGHSSSGGGAGPSGFGSATGCDPKCS